MATALEKLDLEHDLVQVLVTEAVTVGMETPLRDPILEAVEETTGETPDAIGDGDVADTSEKRRVTKVIQGGAVFIVLFVVLYGTLRRLTSDGSDS